MYIKASILCLFLLMFPVRHSLAEECTITYGVYEDYRPYEWLEQGEFHGINIELVNAIGKKANCSVNFVSYPWFEMVEKLKSGEITLLASSINSDTIEYAFPLPTLFVRYRILLGRSDSKKVTDLDELNGKRILLKRDSVTYASLKKANINADLIFKYSDAELLSSFVNGEGDFAFVDDSAFNYIAEFPALKIVSDPLFPTLYGFIIKPDSPLFSKINGAIEVLQNSGTYYHIINNATASKYTRLLKIASLIITMGFAVFLLIMLWNKSLRYNVAKKTKELMEKSKENSDNIRLLQAILNAIPEKIFIIDKSLNILWNNKEKISDFNMNDAGEEISRRIHNLSDIDEFSIKDKDGILWKILILTFCYQNDDNFLIIVTDITENVRLRDEMFMTTRYSALGEMSAIIAHEINTPLGSVLHNLDYLFGYISCPDNKTESDDIKQAQSSVINSLDKIKNIVDELKKYTNRNAREYEKVDLRECVKSAVGITRFFINKKTSHFFVDTESSLDVTTYGNYGQIEQMIINILQNACYALTDKSQSITCSIEKQEKHIKITVKDEGCGMPADVRKNACNPYFTTRKGSGGTGLGLSLTSRLISEHKGYMEIKSNEDEGTEVSLYFPNGGAE